MDLGSLVSASASLSAHWLADAAATRALLALISHAFRRK